jgi:hypothetical protein
MSLNQVDIFSTFYNTILLAEDNKDLEQEKVKLQNILTGTQYFGKGVFKEITFLDKIGDENAVEIYNISYVDDDGSIYVNIRNDKFHANNSLTKFIRNCGLKGLNIVKSRHVEHDFFEFDEENKCIKLINNIAKEDVNNDYSERMFHWLEEKDILSDKISCKFAYINEELFFCAIEYELGIKRVVVEGEEFLELIEEFESDFYSF